MRRLAAFVVGTILLALTGCDEFQRVEVTPVEELQEPAAPSSGFSEKRLARLTEGMQRYVNGPLISGVVTLVHRRGEDIHADVLGMQDVEGGVAMRRDTIFRIYSMSKPITSVAVLILLEEGKLRLTDPVGMWLPELAEPQVMKDAAGPIGETEPARFPITVRDLLTHTSGVAYSFTAPPTLREAITEAGLLGSNSEEIIPDLFMAQLGALPLLYQPGTRWNYSLSTDVLGVLVERVSGQPFAEFLEERVFEPLGMGDTAFWVPAEKLDRFAVNYSIDPKTGERAVFDRPETSTYAKPPSFASGGGGLVSTADDYMRFARMILNEGELDGVRILSRKTVELMTQNSLSDEERPVDDPLASWVLRGKGFGLGVSVVENVGATKAPGSVGRNGWGGAAGTLYFVDFEEDLAAVLMIQLLYSSVPIGQDFQTLVYQAIDD